MQPYHMSDQGDPTCDRAAGTPFAVCGFACQDIMDGAAGSFIEQTGSAI